MRSWLLMTVVGVSIIAGTSSEGTVGLVHAESSSQEALANNDYPDSSNEGTPDKASFMPDDFDQ